MKKFLYLLVLLFPLFTSVNAKNLTVLEVLAKNEDLSVFYKYLMDNGLDKILTKKMPWDWTIFAPNNNAFKNFEKVENSLLSDNFLTKNLLMDHILAGRVSSENIGDSTITDKTVSNKPIQLYKANELYVKDMVILKEDLSAINGVVHSIGCIMFIQPSDEDLRVSKKMQKKFPVTSCCMQKKNEIELWKSRVTMR